MTSAGAPSPAPLQTTADVYFAAGANATGDDVAALYKRLIADSRLAVIGRNPYVEREIAILTS